MDALPYVGDHAFESRPAAREARVSHASADSLRTCFTVERSGTAASAEYRLVDRQRVVSTAPGEG